MNTQDKPLMPLSYVNTPTLNCLNVLDLRGATTILGEPVRLGLLVVDMIHDFVEKKGKLYVPDAQGTISNIVDLVRRARDAKIPTYYPCDEHYPNDPEFKIYWPHAEKGTWGSRLIDPLEQEKNEYGYRIPKIRIDCFYNTELEHLLRVENVNTLIITGTVANICVLAAAHAAALRYIDVIVPMDCWSALEDFGYWVAAYQIEKLYRGKLVKTASGIKFP
jgi:nicotinamidase-related amidase